jgi:hypothetical protein
MKRIRRCAAVLAGLLGTLLAFGAGVPAAFASVPDPGGFGGGAGSPPTPAPVRTVVVAGMPGWQVALITIGSALVAATVAVIADRTRSRRRRLATTPA